MMKLAEYLEKINDQPFILDTIFKTCFAALPDDFNSKITDFAKENYGMRTIRGSITVCRTDEEIKDKINALCTTVAFDNAYGLNVLYKTLNLDYNPIENYNMKEEISDTGKVSHLNITDSTNTEKNTGTVSRVNINSINNGETVNTSVASKTPFDDDTMTDTEKNVTTGNAVVNSESGDATTTNNLNNETVFHNTDDNVEERNLKQTHTRTGNIGVMTTQDMIIQEREVAEFHFLSIFTRKIIGAICLGVYL